MLDMGNSNDLVSIQSHSAVQGSNNFLLGLVSAFEKLKVMRKRGSSRKKPLSVPVKAFQLLGISGHLNKNYKKAVTKVIESKKKNALCEAAMVLETSKQLGLVVKGTQQEALDSIAKRI